MPPDTGKGALVISTAHTDQAARQKAEKKAALAISSARTKLIVSQHQGGKADARTIFFTLLCMRLDPRPSWEFPTGATDGKHLFYNPDWVNGLPDQSTVLGFVVHEVMHCAMGHFARRGHRDMRLWNIACDLAINHIIDESGRTEPRITLPSEGCFPGRGAFANMPTGLSAEAYYSRLQAEASSGKGSGGVRGRPSPGQDGAPAEGEGDGDDMDPGRCGGIVDCADEATARKREADWQVTVVQARNAAKKRGTMSAGLDRTAEECVESRVNWRDVLRRFVNSVARNDYSWMTPNRRYIGQGIYLPNVRSDELGRVVVAVDTSGSIGARELGIFAAELQAVLESYPVEVAIMYHDTHVAGIDTWRSEDGPLEFKPRGGGGTSHVNVFKKIDEDAPPTCVICLTDGYTEYPTDVPPMPVLWIMTTDQQAPFGETIKLDH